jgi:hypothetical protein
MSIQAVRFDRKLWTQGRAEVWLVTHQMRALRLDKTPGQFRFRMADPRQFKRMVAFTPKLKNGAPSKKGVSFVLGYR